MPSWLAETESFCERLRAEVSCGAPCPHSSPAVRIEYCRLANPRVSTKSDRDCKGDVGGVKLDGCRTSKVTKPYHVGIFAGDAKPNGQRLVALCLHLDQRAKIPFVEIWLVAILGRRLVLSPEL